MFVHLTGEAPPALDSRTVGGTKNDGDYSLIGESEFLSLQLTLELCKQQSPLKRYTHICIYTHIHGICSLLQRASCIYVINIKKRQIVQEMQICSNQTLALHDHNIQSPCSIHFQTSPYSGNSSLTYRFLITAFL